MHLTSLNKMKAFVEEYLKEYEDYSLKIIDIGSQAIAGNPTYKPFFNNPNWTYLGLDLVKGENVDIVVKDSYNWIEIEDASVDLVISGQTFEHIEFPWLTIKEIFRILKDRGVVCLIAPSSGWEHRYPVDCWRIFPDGMRALAKWAGFKIVEVFTDWGLDPWRDTFAVFQKPFTDNGNLSPFEKFSNKEVALQVYLNAFKDKPQNPEYYVRAANLLKDRGERGKAQFYMATALSIFPYNLWLRQRAVEVYIETKPLLALEHVIYLLRARPINQENVRLIGRFLEIIKEEERAFIIDQLPNDIPSLRQFASLSEKEKLFLLAEECWRRLSEAQPNDLNAKLMYALMPRGYGKKELSEKRLNELFLYQITNNLLNRTTIIQHLINKFNYRVYLEIGVERGINFYQIRAPIKIGVDLNFKIPGGYESSENEKFFSMNSDEFFSNTPEEILKYGIDIAFIDGLHTYKQTKKDVENCLKYLRPEGIIVIHDCLPTNEAEAMPSLQEAIRHPDFKGLWSGDVYKTILHLRSTRQDLFIAVINVDHGVGILKRGKPEKMLNLKLEEIENLSFKDFIRDKEKLLNLKSEDWFLEFLSEEKKTNLT